MPLKTPYSPPDLPSTGSDALDAIAKGMTRDQFGGLGPSPMAVIGDQPGLLGQIWQAAKGEVNPFTEMVGELGRRMNGLLRDARLGSAGPPQEVDANILRQLRGKQNLSTQGIDYNTGRPLSNLGDLPFRTKGDYQAPGYTRSDRLLSRDDMSNGQAIADKLKAGKRDYEWGSDVVPWLEAGPMMSVKGEAWLSPTQQVKDMLMRRETISRTGGGGQIQSLEGNWLSPREMQILERRIPPMPPSAE